MDMVLQTTSLTKQFGKQLAVNNVNLTIEKGCIYGLIGKNGAGKTTIMKMVCGLIAPTKGEIKLFDNSNLDKGRRRIGCVIEQPALYPDFTAKQNLIFYNKLLGNPSNDNLSRLFELVGLPDPGRKRSKISRFV